MPEMKTEHVTTHTITLTDFELESLREAARIALRETDAGVHTAVWKALSRLGLPATRSAPRADEGLTAAHTDRGLIR